MQNLVQNLIQDSKKEITSLQSVLIVDDLAANVLALKAVLEEENYHVDTAHSGKEAITKALNNTYGLVLIDVQMPDMDGFDVAEILKSNTVTKDFPIIFLTALGNDCKHIKRGLQTGAIDYISKPLDTDILRLKIHNHFVNFNRQQELKKSKKHLLDLSITLANKTQDVQDSINYAELIQRSIFPNIELLEKRLKESFIIYKPKDTIGGDFYWMDKLNSRIITICADCTGHGIPGAMLSMIGYQSLTQIIREKRIFDPGKILSHLHKRIKTILTEESDLLPHGMDISVCVYRLEDDVLEYASARRPIFIQNENEIIEFKGDPFSIGDDTDEGFSYTTYYHNVTEPSWLYQFSDGMQDQFGGPRVRKFGKLRLKNTIQSLINYSSIKQKSGIKNELYKWMKDEDQVDDITLFGHQLVPNNLF